MTSEELKSNIAKSLSTIRKVIDSDVTGCDIDTVVEKVKTLTQLCGTAAECKAQSSKLLHMKQLEVLKSHEDSKLPASILSKTIDAECYDEGALLVYADRINAGISHALDALRSVISLYKTEMEYGMNDTNTQRQH